MIFGSLLNFEGSVELFEEDEASDLMRESQLGKADFLFGIAQDFVRQPFSAADDKTQAGSRYF